MDGVTEKIVRDRAVKRPAKLSRRSSGSETEVGTERLDAQQLNAVITEKVRQLGAANKQERPGVGSPWENKDEQLGAADEVVVYDDTVASAREVTIMMEKERARRDRAVRFQKKRLESMTVACDDTHAEVALDVRVPLNSAVLDGLLQGVSKLKSRVFFDLEQQDCNEWRAVGSEIRLMEKPARFPVWVRHHWIGFEVDVEVTRVFDSAASEIVQRDVRRFTQRLGIAAPEFMLTPQQHRNSNECGIFVAMFLHARSKGIPIPQVPAKISLRCTHGPTTQALFVERALKELECARCGPQGRGSPMTNAEVRHVLQNVEVGTRLLHVFYIPSEPERELKWYGTVTGLPASSRPSAQKWRIEFDPYDEEDEEQPEEDFEWSTALGMLPAPRGEAVTLTVEVVARSQSFRCDGETLRDYALPPEPHDQRPTDEWPDATAENCPDQISGQLYADLRLLSYEEAERRSGSMLAWGALTQSVRRNHLNELSKLQQFIKSQQHKSAHLQVYLNLYIAKRRSEAKLSWSTVARLVGSLIGAFAALHYYANGGFHLSLVRWPMIRDLLTHATRLVAKHGSREPLAAKPKQVHRAIVKLVNDGQDGEAAALALCWYSAQRPCDVLLLKMDNIKVTLGERPLGEGFSGDKFVVKFREGKVVGRIEAYHIHMTVPNLFAATAINKWLEKRKRSSEGTLFRFTNGYRRTKFLTNMRKALKASNTDLELRSLRRGTLQMYNRAGIPEAALLTYSRHTSVPSLRRYLGWEAIETDEHRLLMSKASVLAPSGAGEPKENECNFCPADWIGIAKDGRLEIASDHPPPPPGLTSIDRSKYDLLAKPQSIIPVNNERMDELAKSCSEQVRQFYQEARTFRDDPSLYESIPSDTEVPVSKMVERQLEQSVGVRHSIPVTHDEVGKIKHTCRVFVVNEDEKVPPRARMVTHTELLNNVLNRWKWARRIRNTSRRQARQAVMKYPGCISLDFAGWFQQISVSEEVSWHFCFRIRGEWYRYVRQPTGASWSTDVAIAHTMVLVDKTPSMVDVSVCTDNVRFAADTREQTIEAAWVFVQRCRGVNAELNELDVHTATKEDVAQLYSTEGDDFFGEVSDYGNSTVACRPKHVRRLGQYVQAASKTGATNAVLFGLYAMLLYMSETLGDDLRERRGERLWFARRARDIAKENTKWDEPPTVPPPMRLLRSWASQLEKNLPAKVVPAPAVSDVIHIDACKEGFAAVVVPKHGNPWLLQHRWTGEEAKRLNVRRSTNSEPEAVARVSEILVANGRAGRHLYISDHEQFTYALQKGHSLSEENNERLRRLAPWSDVVYEPGRLSIADPFSRFKKSLLTSEDVDEAVARSRVYADACRRGAAYGIVGWGRSAPSRVFRETPTQRVPTP